MSRRRSISIRRRQPRRPRRRTRQICLPTEEPRPVQPRMKRTTRALAPATFRKWIPRFSLKKARNWETPCLTRTSCLAPKRSPTVSTTSRLPLKSATSGTTVAVLDLIGSPHPWCYWSTRLGHRHASPISLILQPQQHGLYRVFHLDHHNRFVSTPSTAPYFSFLVHRPIALLCFPLFHLLCPSPPLVKLNCALLVALLRNY